MGWVRPISAVLLLCFCVLCQSLRFPWEHHRARISSRQARPQSFQPKPTIEFKDFTDDEASLYFVARQKLLDFATVQGLDILPKLVPTLNIPPYEDDVDVAVVGSVHVVVSDLQVKSFTLPSAHASTQIQAGQYWFHASDVQLHVTFKWHWEKGPIQGTGLGELHLTGGDVDITFTANDDPGTLTVAVTDARTSFDKVDVSIHSFSADWLYQVLLKIFQNSLKGQVEDAFEHALETTLPEQLNSVLATVPSSMDISGLPFKASFKYAIYTLQYVLVKGYGAVELARLLGLPACPVVGSRIPLASEDVARDSHMLTLYLEESVLSCLSWGLFSRGVLATSVQDGQVPNVHLVTEVFGSLMPDLPKLYPRHSLRLDMAATAAPTVAFSPSSNTTITLAYTTSFVVLNATGNSDDLHVATVATSMVVSLDLQWETTAVLGSTINSSVVDASLEVKTAAYDGLLTWFLKMYAPKMVLKQQVEKYAKTKVTSVVGVQDVQFTTYDSWLGFSADATLKRKWPFKPKDAVATV